MPAHPPAPTIDEVRSAHPRARKTTKEAKGSAAQPAPPIISIRIPLRLVGTILLGFVAISLVALASWSVDDPSLSYATDKNPANWLGFPGAVIADLFFQVLGLASLVMLLPPALWGWAMIRRYQVPHMVLRLGSWILATLLAAGVLAFVPMPQTWPLPTGLGGLVGSGFSTLLAMIAGPDYQSITSTLFAIIVAAPALALFWKALALGQTVPTAPGALDKHREAGAQALEESDEPETNPILDIAIGAAVHMGYSVRTAFRRARDRYRSSDRKAPADHEMEPSLEPGFAHQQPDQLAAAPRRVAAAPAAAPEPAPWDEVDDDAEPMTGAREQAYREQETYRDIEPEDLYPPDQDDEDFIDHAEPPMAPQAAASASAPTGPRRGDSRFLSARVAAPAPRPAPGARQVREAQGSLAFSDNNSGFELPELDLLAAPRHSGVSDEHRPERLEEMARKLEGVLEDFGVKGDIINVRPGPVVTLFELEPAPGIKSSRVISLADDIARSMSAHSARVAVVPGRNAIGIELPNKQRETVYLREMLGSSDFEKMKGKLPICLGKTIGGEPVIADLARMPHLLIAGTTGSGKSVGINTMILSLLYQMTPEQCRLIMIDPKMLELSIYDGIPHLLTPVVTDPSKAVVALKWAVREMEDRYRKMSKIGVRNIDGFNQRVNEAKEKGEVLSRTVQTGFDRETGEAIFESEEFDLEPLPYIVVIVDEMADLMMVAGKEIEGAIQRLAQMARAAGIHMITATQRPSVDVITGTIKANFPTRISFMVTSKIDSRTILGEQGAEQLLGNGDMLYMAGGGRIKRLHGPFVADGEVESIVTHLKSQGVPDYLESVTEEPEDAGGSLSDGPASSGDELYDKAVNIVLNDKKASTSYIQRRLAVGYNKAATLIERMEQEGVISPANHAGKREILVGDNADGY
ncbi:DNA translocase FtsK [Devosia pacifica]|nr:DNA translocase FtsK [Devosia pacifica]